MSSVASLSPQVSAWSLILTWPLAVRGWTNPVTLDRIDEAVGAAPWRRVERPLFHLRDQPASATAAPDRDEYAEYLYFYPFIRRFLYDGDGHAMRLYRRGDITRARLRLAVPGSGVVEVTVRVPRVNLYAFNTGDCVLAVEFSLDGDEAQVTEEDGATRPLRLGDVLALNERLRRAYPPYFTDHGEPGYRMEGVCWEGMAPSPPMTFSEAGQAVRDRQTPMAAHWRQLLPDLSASGLNWSQVMDDRIPAMTYLALSDPQAIGRGDWVRLANFDEDDGADLPYAADFLEDFEARHCYDRFWEPPGRACRYLCSGFGFVMVEKGDGHSPYQGYFRRHYFQMGLLNQFHLAALQSLSHRLSQALSEPDWEAEAPAILNDLMTFTHTYWFPSVSNQIQAKELYQLWRSHLGVEALYSQVSAEASQGNSVLNRQIDSRAADSATLLNRVGAIGLGAALATGFLGMNILVPSGDAAKDLLGWSNPTGWLILAVVMAGWGAFLGLTAWVVGRRSRTRKRR